MNVALSSSIILNIALLLIVVSSVLQTSNQYSPLYALTTISCPTANQHAANIFITNVDAASPNYCTDAEAAYPIRVPSHLKEYCDTPYPMTTPYTPPARYTADDIVIGLLTVDTYKFTRDESCMHSWLNPVRAPRAYFTNTKHRNPALMQPEIFIPNTTDDYISNLNKTLIGLRELYYSHPDAKWYMLSSDDAFLNVHYILKKLEPYDSDTVMYTGGFSWEHEPCANSGYHARYAAGGPGIILSHATMVRFHDKFEDWLMHEWLAGTQGHTEYGDHMVGCFFHDHNITLDPYIKGFMVGPPTNHDITEWARAFFEPGSRDYDEEINNWHYVTPELMMDADLYFALNHIDRLQRHRQYRLLADYARQMAVERYHINTRSIKLVQKLDKAVDLT